MKITDVRGTQFYISYIPYGRKKAVWELVRAETRWKGSLGSVGDTLVLKSKSKSPDMLPVVRAIKWLTEHFFVDHEHNVCHDSHYRPYDDKKDTFPKLSGIPWPTAVNQKCLHVNDVYSNQMSWGHARTDDGQLRDELIFNIDYSQYGRQFNYHGYGMWFMHITDFVDIFGAGPYWQFGRSWFEGDWEGKKADKVGFQVKLREDYNPNLAGWVDPISYTVTVEKFIGSNFFLSEFGYICRVSNYEVVKKYLKLQRRALILL